MLNKGKLRAVEITIPCSEFVSHKTENRSYNCQFKGESVNFVLKTVHRTISFQNSLDYTVTPKPDIEA